MTGKPPVSLLLVGIASHVKVIEIPSLTVFVRPVGAVCGTFPGVVQDKTAPLKRPLPQALVAITLALYAVLYSKFALGYISKY